MIGGGRGGDYIPVGKSVLAFISDVFLESVG